MPAAGRLSYEELAALVVRQAGQIELLKVEVADLRRQLVQNCVRPGKTEPMPL
jgi:hypothetical protein